MATRYWKVTDSDLFRTIDEGFKARLAMAIEAERLLKEEGYDVKNLLQRHGPTKWIIVGFTINDFKALPNKDQFLKKEFPHLIPKVKSPLTKLLKPFRDSWIVDVEKSTGFKQFHDGGSMHFYRLGIQVVDETTIVLKTSAPEQTEMVGCCRISDLEYEKLIKK